MSGSKPVKEGDLEDLSIRARRFGLSLAEERLLDRACEASPTVRVSLEVGRDFDRIALVHAGDDELIARAADRVLTLARPRRRRGRWSWGAIAGVTLLSSVAFAWWGGGARLREPGLDRAGALSTNPPPVAHLGAASTAPREPAEEHAREDLLDRAPEAPSPRPALDELARPSAIEHVQPASPRASARARKSHAGVHGAATSEAVAVLDADTARDWFRKANAARRDGDLASASALYAGLQSKFPTSDEARLSHVSLGKLLLSSGRAADAERQFSLYIAAGGGELAEEALVGRAESLRRLGRTAEERKTWQSLLRDSPAGIYAARAKQRLEDLDSGDLPSR